LTGGTPLLIGTERIEDIIKNLMEIEHIKQVYIAIGRPIMDPGLITDEFSEMLARHNKPNLADPSNSKSVSCTVHINHPDEMTPEVVSALQKLTSRGINVWTQTAIYKGINDDEKTISRLYQMFSANNLIPYYLFHVMPMTGIGHFRTTVEKGIKIIRYLEQFSGHERPIYSAVTEIGKVQFTGNSILKYKMLDGKRHIVIKTPYKAKSFMETNKISELPEKCFEDKDGYIVLYYLDGED
jgi:lysine 2,3-aminomutase